MAGLATLSKTDRESHKSLSPTKVASGAVTLVSKGFQDFGSRLYSRLFAIISFTAWRFRMRTMLRMAVTSSGSLVDVAPADASDNFYIINLAHRTDRIDRLDQHLARLHMPKYQRFEAVAHTDGAVGCALSHKEILQAARSAGLPYVIIAEDDLEIVVTKDELDILISEFLANPFLSVLCLSYVTESPIQPISRRLGASNNVRTTGFYVAKSEVFEILEFCALESAHELQIGLPRSVAAYDMKWQELQNQKIFALPRDLVARQRESYSDVAKKDANYWKIVRDES